MGNILGYNQWATTYDDSNFYSVSSNSTSTVLYPCNEVPLSTWQLEEWSLENQPDCKLTKEQLKKRNQERQDAKTRALVDRIRASQPPDKVPEASVTPADFEEI